MRAQRPGHPRKPKGALLKQETWASLSFHQNLLKQNIPSAERGSYLTYLSLGDSWLQHSIPAAVTRWAWMSPSPH